MIRLLIACVLAFVVAFPTATARGQQRVPGAGPVIVLETAKGVIEIETYPEDAPKTVAHIVALVKRGFYNGLRFHRVEPKFVVQVGDPQTRNVQLQDAWGRGNSGKPIGAAEISKRRRHVFGAVGVGHAGDPKAADSHIYITLAARPGLDGKYTVFGRVTTGMDVAERLQRADVLKRATVKAGTEAP